MYVTITLIFSPSANVVSVLRQQFINYNGVDMQVGENIRNAYSNNEDDRASLKSILSDEYYNAVMAVWQ